MIGLFVHIPKTGGTFLREYFKRANDNIIQFGHQRLSEYNIHQISLDNCFKFAFIRNPWDWYVSRYFYFCRSPVTEQGLSIKCDSGLGHIKFIKKFPTFKDHMIWGDSSQNLNFWLSYRYKEMCFVDGKDLINYVGKFESIENSICEIFKKCDVKCEISYQDFYCKAKRYFNSTTHNHYSYYYDNELIDLIYERDKEIITNFNYQYEKIK